MVKQRQTQKTHSEKEKRVAAEYLPSVEACFCQTKTAPLDKRI
jgi:hypothetical protein